MELPQFEMEETRCPLCDSQRWKPFRSARDRLAVTEREFTFVRCENCGLVYQNPRVTPSTISAFYPHTYFVSRPGRSGRNEARAKKFVAKKCDLVEKCAPRPGTLLEIGSANGDFLAGMRERGWQVQGVEVSSDAAEFSRTQHQINVFCGELLDRPDNGDRFDTIILWAVLPHIHNPVPTISHASNLLTPHGKLIISCANIDSYVAERLGNRWGHLDLPRHYCMWSPDTLTRLYNSAQLTVNEIIHHDDVYNSNLMLPWLSPLIYSSGRNIGYALARRAAYRLNQLLTQPVLARARAQKRGGIVTVIGSNERAS